MGAAGFWTEAIGRSADEAFRCATDRARYEHGHGGYTGSIAEKHEFKLMHVSKAELLHWLDHEIQESRKVLRGRVGWEAENWQRNLQAAEQERARVASGGTPSPEAFAQILYGLWHGPGFDKWGPAVAVQLSPKPGDFPGCKRFVFFGLASA